MKRKDRLKTWLALAACILLFAASLALALLTEGQPSQNTDTATGGIVISEVMSANLTYPDGNGKLLDYIEIHNPSDAAVDISNFKLSDDEATIGFTFPQGTVLPAKGYVVCWCDAQSNSDAYADFQLSRKGGETVYLYNSANVCIDRLTIPALETNTAYALQANGRWSVSAAGSPGYANTDEGNAQWLTSIGYKIPQLVISEVQTSNSHTWLDSDGTVCDWVEIYNAGTEAAVLDGAYLSDDPADPLQWAIPSLTIEPGEYALIRCGDGTGAPFGLDRSGCVLILTGQFGNRLAALECPALERNTSWAMQEDGTYAAVAAATPGFENTDLGYSLWLDDLGMSTPSVIITEIQTANRSAILNSYGELCDWVELYNAGSAAVVLDGTYLSDDPAEPLKWQIPSLTIQPGEYAVIPCVGVGAAAGEATFGLPRSGCTVLLTGPVGNVISKVSCPALGEDRSWQYLPDGSYTESAAVSPGYENTEAGHKAYMATRTILGDLAVYEVMPSNSRYLIQSDGEFYDWIELKNVSDHTIDLSDYAISDTSGDLLLCLLPQQTLKPGETVVIICSGKEELNGRYIHAPFTLDREECWVYVTHMALGLSDYVHISGVPVQGSAGRMDGDSAIVYFTTPTPGKENAGGVAEVSHTPFVETPDGVYNGVERVSVVLSGEGQIRYTLDGSTPTMNSALYTGPLTLTQTTVVRFRSYCDGKLPSQVVTASYIINENHTLPVISIAANPWDLFGDSGIYTQYKQNWEVPCSLTLYEGDGGFTIDCGLKMYGHTGLQMNKKSFKVNFRGRYGADLLTYPVYGEEGPEVYDSLCIRAGQDYPQAIFRDELFTSLCRDMGDHVLAQRDKFCILYVNGEYFGIYCMKEAFCEMYYAQNRGVSEESVEIIQAPVGISNEIYKFIRYVETHDMTKDEHYEYACSVFNMESLIDWIIIQGYSTNGDVQQNLRYFRSTDNGNRFEMAFYDLDWSFYYHVPFRHVLSREREWQHLRFTMNLIKNPTFRQQFLERLSYHLENTLSTENVLARIEHYYDLLSPEVARERRRWGGTVSGWESQVDKLRNFITLSDHPRDILDRLIMYIGLTREEINTYFWRWA